MNISLLLFVLCLLINSSKCGLEIFKFTSQPKSQTVNPGGSVTLSCVATGRTGITYSWYKLQTDFSTPPSESNDLIKGETGTQYTVQAADVDEKDDRSLFQCKATAGDDIILSNVATVKYTLADNIEYDSTGKSYIDVPISTPDDVQEYGVFLFKLRCNTNEVDFNKFITNGEPYDVQWFKTGDNKTRVEDKYNNMWTYYSNSAGTSSDLEVVLGGDFKPDLTNVKQYDLVIFNVQTSDAGTYSCKAVSRTNKKEVLLGSTVLTVPEENNNHPFKPLKMVTGYMVLAVDETGKVKSTPNDGEKVLLMCGAPCRKSSGTYNPQYQWKDNSGTVIASTREHIVTVSSTGTVTYTCEIQNSDCISSVSSKTVTITAKAAEINPMLNFTFSKSSPEYMWYDTSDNTESHTPFEIGCEGSFSSGNAPLFNRIYKMPTAVTNANEINTFNFGSNFTSDKSGVYQCAINNYPNKILWYQKTTNVVIAAPSKATIVPTIISVKHDATATFTCNVGGYPVKSVTISRPKSLDLDCISSQSSGDVTCRSNDTKIYVVNVRNFELSDAGNYTCTVETEWYKSRSSSAITTSAHDEVTLSFESTTKLTASSNPANKGSSVTLTCVVKGNPAPSKPLLTKRVSSSTTNIDMTCSGTTTKTCKKEFSSAVYTDSGDYTCNGENLINGVKNSSSDTLTLSIVGDADATLAQNPAGTELNKDSSVAFTCKIEGNPRPTKLTFKKGSKEFKKYDANDGTSDSDKIVTATYHITYTHTFSSLALDDTGEYTCEGENDNGGRKTDAATKTLTVVSDVVVTIAASTKTPTVGSKFTITCTATGGKKPHSVELKQDDTLISGTGFSCSDVGDYSVKCTYQQTADYSSGGTYSCIGKNRVASSAERVDTKTLDISVSKEVAVSLTPSSDTEIEVTYGDAYTITCNVEGGDQPHKVTLNVPGSNTDLIWQRDSSGSTLTCNGEFQLVCEYTIANLAYSHEGQYTCTGYNKLPGENSDRTDDASVALVVVKNVTVTLRDSIIANSNEVYYGNTFSITCVADGGRIPFYLEFSHTPTTSSTNQLVLYDRTSSTTPVTVTVDQGANTLTYVHSVTSSSYNDNGAYKCLSKNNAASKAEAKDEEETNILVVKNVTSTITAPAIVDKGSQFTITCVAEGYRAPHYIALERDDVTEKTWDRDTNCISLSFYKFQCNYTVASSGYINHGKYTCVSKNNALRDKEVSNKDSKNVQISQTVLTELIPNSEKELELSGPTLTMTCNIEGGLEPHKATLELPGGNILTWNRDATSGVIQNPLTCTGENEIQCFHEVLSTTYDSSGKYNCTGYNKLPGNLTTDHSKSKTVDVVIVKDVTASITSNLGSDEVDWGTELKLTCKVEGGRTPFYLLVQFTDGAGTNSTLIEFNEPKQSGTIIQKKNSLEYVHIIDNVTYTNSGSYKCKGKNRALRNEVKTSEAMKNAVVVKNVEIDPIADIEADFGNSFILSFTLNGGRSPHSVTLDGPGSRLFNWQTSGSECTGTNTLNCSYTIGGSDVNFGADGTFTVTAKNKASNDVEKSATKKFVVTVYKDVSAAILPNSDSDITYHEDKTITCKVEGGLPPHQVDLFLGNKGTKTWKKDGTETSLMCNGTHTLTCEHTFTPEYDSDGDYKCKGYNEVRKVQKEIESPSVKLTTVRSTIVTVSSESLSVLTTGTLKVDCIVVGKPLVDKSTVTWTHETVTSLNLAQFVNTTKGSADDYTLNSTLIIPNPPKNYSGIFKCNVQDGAKPKSVQVSIHYQEFLEPPQVSHNSTGEAIKEGVQLAVTCRVKGFPRPSAFLFYENVEDGAFKQNVTLKDPKFESDTSTVFVYVLTTKCDYSQYKFICETQTTKNNNKTVLTKSISAGPLVTGCTDMLPVIGGGVGGGVVFIIIIVVVVVCILKKIRGNKSDSFSPKNGTQIPNPAFSPDPSYATVGDTQASLGYSHLNRPAGVEAADNYDSIAHLKPNAVPPVDEDSYQTLDTASNGRLGHQRKKSDEVYAALNRPAPGKEKRGVVRKYRPIANKPRNTFGSPPNKRLTENIEMGETSHSSQPEPTYATVNPQTMKSREKPSEYADVTLPDLPPEVPEYGQMSRQPISSEYADVTIPQPQPSSSEYADVTIPGFVPEVPLYSNMGEMQESDPAEDPVYAQVDLRSRSAKKPPPVEDEEDLPPDVPVYGTMGELTEPDNPVDDEDPYATVEFVPKSKRKPPRPKVKESTGDGVYATITDIKENP